MSSSVGRLLPDRGVGGLARLLAVGHKVDLMGRHFRSIDRYDFDLNKWGQRIVFDWNSSLVATEPSLEFRGLAQAGRWSERLYPFGRPEPESMDNSWNICFPLPKSD